MLFFRYFFVLLLTAISLHGVSRPSSDTRTKQDEVQPLFPGTGFFVKNRDSYDSSEAKDWFLQAVQLEKKNENSKALKIYEKFIKRRSDLILRREDKKIIVGAEAIYRASALREKAGDWKTAFDYLQLIAKAYPSYDFTKVADSLMRLAERLAKDKLPKKWGFLPRFRSGSEDRKRLSQIADLARGPRYAPRALIVLAEIALKDEKQEDAIDALERLINNYPDNYLCEQAYFQLGEIYKNRVTGPSYDQGSTLKALNFFEDYLILFDYPPSKGKRESTQSFEQRISSYKKRKESALRSRRELRQTLASSKLEIARYLEEYGKYFLVRWKELGNGPALQFYNEAITIAPESNAAREAEKKFLNSEVNRKHFFLFGLISLSFLSCGCSYKLGGLRFQEGKLHLVVRNDSLAPQLGPLVDQEIRKAFISFHQYELVNDANSADYHLLVTLKSYQSLPESYQREDALYASGFGMKIKALMNFSSREGDKTLELTSDATASVVRNDKLLIPIKDQAIHALAVDLASQVSFSLLNATL